MPNAGRTAHPPRTLTLLAPLAAHTLNPHAALAADRDLLRALAAHRVRVGFRLRGERGVDGAAIGILIRNHFFFIAGKRAPCLEEAAVVFAGELTLLER